MNRREGDRVGAFVERFAGQLADAGMPRMPARVFVLLLAEEDGAATATELSERLQASAGAVSGAVRYLIRVGLADREQLPGSRRDYYRVRPDVWYAVVADQHTRYARWNAQLDDGVAAVGADTTAGRRLSDTRDFFGFLAREMPVLIERWHAQRNGDQEDRSDEQSNEQSDEQSDEH